MKIRTALLLGLALTCQVVSAVPSHAARSGYALPAGSQVAVSDSFYDANELRMSVSNLGRFAHDVSSPNGYFPGLEWPRGTGRNALFAGGLWVGAKVGGETRVTVAEYASEFAAGPLDGTGQPIDPTEADPAHRVYKIRRGDNASTNPDWAQWPIALGAPDDGAGNPRVIGDQTLWSVYNDAVASKHTVKPGSSAPLGIEIRQAVFGFDRPGPIGRMLFIQFDLYNKGPSLLDSTYVGLWCDPDLGSASDDLVGCDTTLDLGYCYNADDNDLVYGTHPPAVGIQLLKGPLVLGGDLRMSAFGRLLKNYLEPDTPLESYARFQGIREDGSDQTCDRQFTPFEVAGDPVVAPAWDPSEAAARCMDSTPADRRFMLSTGPFGFPSGTSKRIVIAVIVGGRDGIGDRLGNLERLRSYARVARQIYALGFDNVGAAGELDPGDTRLAQRLEPVTFDGTRTTPGTGAAPSYQWDYGDGSQSQSGALQQSHIYTTGGVRKAILYAQGGDFPASCGVRVDVFDPVTATNRFSNITPGRPFNVYYSGYPPSDPAKLVGVDWGGRYFGRGFDIGCRFLGSSIVGEFDDWTRCPPPATTLAPERFKSVLLDFGPTQKAYRYLRRELTSGAEPAAGHGFVYGGRGDVDFKAYGIVGDSLTPLEVAFTERQITDDNGDPSGFVQPASQNNLWVPTSATDGGHEYLSILDVPYSNIEDPSLARDGAFADGTAPVLYSGWLRLGFPLGWDANDALYVETPNLALGRAGGADASFSSEGQGAFLLVANRDATSRLITSSSGVFFRELGGDGDAYLFPGSQIPTRLPAGALDGARAGAWGDYDADGFADLFAVRDGKPNLLLHRGSDGSALFTAVGAAVLDGPGTSTHAAWADYDLDGDLDLYVVNGPNPNRLFRNDGAAGFADATSGPLVGRSDGRRAVWADYDGDRDPDLFLCNGASLDQLLRNDGAAGFTDVTPVLLQNNTVDAAWGDFDNDGDLDLLVAHFQLQLLRNDGAAGFNDITTLAISFGRRAQRVAWVDYDLDGDQDIAVADAADGFHLLANMGGGTFEDALLSGLPFGFGPITSATSFALADLEADGDPDIYVVGAGQNALFRNDRGSGRWIHVNLAGTISPRGGAGARIRVVTRWNRQTRYVSVAEDASVATTFGVGGAAVVDTVEVTWPSGVVNRVTGVPLFTDVTVTESAPTAGGGIAFVHIAPNPSAGSARIELLIPPGSGDAEIRIHDLTGRLVWSWRLSDPVGVQSVTWNGLDRDRRRVPAGIYFVRATYAGKAASSRIVLIR